MRVSGPSGEGGRHRSFNSSAVIWNTSRDGPEIPEAEGREIAIGENVDEEPLRSITAAELRSLVRPLGVGWGVNPIQNIPIEYSSQNSRLMEFLVYSSNKDSYPVSEIWFSLALTDKSSFHLLLATVATAVQKLTGVETAEATKHYTLSLKSVATRMNDPNERTSEGVISSILGFACQDVRATSDVRC